MRNENLAKNSGGNHETQSQQDEPARLGQSIQEGHHPGHIVSPVLE
jgi:hypothetical protein